MSRVSHAIDRIEVTFDDETLVANAGLIVPATLMVRLGLEALVNSTVRLVGRVGGARPGRKVLTLVHAILAGGSHIDHADMLRAGATARVLPFRVMAPVDVGDVPAGVHVRSCPPARRGDRRDDPPGVGAGRRSRRRRDDDRSGLDDLRGGRQAQAGRRLRLHEGARLPPAAGHPGRHRRGAARPAAQGLGQHQRGAKRFVEELIARVRRAGATGALTVRVDSGFWSYDADRHARPGSGCATRSRCASTPASAAAIDAIDETAWTTIDYPDGGQAQVAECVYVTGHGRHRRELRLVVRRTRLTDPAQRRLWPDWRHHAFITDLERRHRRRRRSSTATTPSSSSPSATSKKAPDSNTARPASSSPTPPGCLRRARPQPHPLDRPPRRRAPRRTTHRRPHHPHPTPRAPRPARQPQRPAGAATPRPMAMGERRSTPRSTGSARCRYSPDRDPRTGAAADDHHALDTPTPATTSASTRPHSDRTSTTTDSRCQRTCQPPHPSPAPRPPARATTSGLTPGPD